MDDERFIYVCVFQILVSGHHDQAALLGSRIVELAVLGLVEKIGRSEYDGQKKLATKSFSSVFQGKIRTKEKKD